MKAKKTKRVNRPHNLSLRMDDSELKTLIEKADKYARGNISELLRRAVAAFNG